MLNASAEATARNTALLGLIILGAYLLNYVLTTSQRAAGAWRADGGPALAALGRHGLASWRSTSRSAPSWRASP
jgi:hypothetical protein